MVVSRMRTLHSVPRWHVSRNRLSWSWKMAAQLRVWLDWQRSTPQFWLRHGRRLPLPHLCASQPSCSNDWQILTRRLLLDPTLRQPGWQ